MNFIASFLYLLCSEILSVCGLAAWPCVVPLSNGSIDQLNPAGAFCSSFDSTYLSARISGYFPAKNPGRISGPDWARDVGAITPESRRALTRFGTSSSLSVTAIVGLAVPPERYCPPKASPPDMSPSAGDLRLQANPYPSPAGLSFVALVARSSHVHGLSRVGSEIPAAVSASVFANRVYNCAIVGTPEIFPS